jgi:hypothetical protein
MDLNAFKEEHIEVVFQQFTHPVYKQLNNSEFVPGLSILDCLFNIGIAETKKLFWNNIHHIAE